MVKFYHYDYYVDVVINFLVIIEIKFVILNFFKNIYTLKYQFNSI
jgi:hypothetical protein